jgi:crossover junction endodeoxyribonuclease RuvC
MRVLGVDPGLTRCGMAVVSAASGRRVELVSVTVVRTPADEELPARLQQIHQHAAELIVTAQPDVVAVERVFSQHNTRTAMGTAQAAAMVMLAAQTAGIAVHSHTPSEVKAAVTGYGNADKDQVAAMVVRLLRLAETPRPADATDALALAICHAWRAPLHQRLREVRA